MYSILKYSFSLPRQFIDFINRLLSPTFKLTTANKPFKTTDSGMPEHHKHIHFLNEVLQAIVENPNSSTSFDILLQEIQRLSKADSAALFLLDESGTPGLVSITNNTKSELFKGYFNQISIDSNYNAQNENINDKDHEIKLIHISDARSNPCGVLILIVHKNNAQNLPLHEIESIKHSLSGIISSIQQADISKRMALHEERALIARELHDSLAQSLSYLKIQVSRLQTLIKPNLAREEVDLSAVDGITEELRTNLNISYKQLRELITTFRLTLSSKNLAQALEDSVEEFENRSSILFNLDNRLAMSDLAVDEEIQVLQIVREAISNIVRHSKAEHAEITLTKHESHEIKISIDDDGVGIDDLHTHKHRHGMIIMQQRAHDLGGKLRVQQSCLGGTQIMVSFAANNNRNYQTNLKY